MFWLGKFIGGIFGYIIAGPGGALIGLLLGHYFDNSCKQHWFLPSFVGPRTQVQHTFFKATFLVMGYIAKADGRVSEREIRAAKQIMHNMTLPLHLKQQAISYFQQGKAGNFHIDQVLSALTHACRGQPHLRHAFFAQQLQVAYADGDLPPTKQKILEYICYRLGLDPAAYRYQQHQHQYHSPLRKETQLSKAYQTLNVPTGISNADLKKVYRKLISQHHPDKLISKGVSEEKLKLATQKTQEIKLAYETICEARGI